MLTAYIAMGANIAGPAGAPAATLASAALRLGELGRLLRRSSLYSTSPVGFAEQPRFFNAVVALETALSPHALLDALLDLEREYGRDRSLGPRNGPRTLDLDILMLGDLCLSESDLEIPHPRLAERAFVLVPLNEIAPQAVVPRHRATAAQLLDRLRHGEDADAEHVAPVHDDLWRAGPNPGPAPTA
ncbi:MAG TPA: 2-amino-4-hydroxy-6-hydroxymethyldihydropteridine diphosphokinase [Terracidiphilus sp.]|nr:2-amino-4-hydroxy-6-hydroxymethyldihydropteridine diphosphokinase [Terracidiphilus sp.]